MISLVAVWTALRIDNKIEMTNTQILQCLVQSSEHDRADVDELKETICLLSSELEDLIIEITQSKPKLYEVVFKLFALAKYHKASMIKVVNDIE